MNSSKRSLESGVWSLRLRILWQDFNDKILMTINSKSDNYELSETNHIEFSSKNSAGGLQTPDSRLPTSFVVAENITKTYESGQNRVTVFEDMSIEIAEGEMVAIVGPSGAGKSTLLHLLGGLDKPSKGTVKIGQFDISKLSEIDLARFRNKEIGFIFQFHHLLPEFTALENVMMPLLIARLSQKNARERAASLLSDVGLASRATHRPGEMSGGEQARVALARALVASPRLLLADEPTGDLDSKTSESIHNLLKEIHRSQKLTSVIVTHNERLAAICDRVLHLEDGRFHTDAR